MNKNMIIDEIKNALGNVEITFVEVPKNNVVRKGVSIREDGSDVAATFYYNEDDDDATIIKNTITGYQANGKPDFDVSDITRNITNWDWVADKVVPTLFNATRTAFPDEIITLPYVNDISISFRVILPNMGEGTASVKVTKNLLDNWGIDEDTLFAYAKRNLDAQLKIKDMQELMYEMTGDEKFKREIQVGVMSVMTNTTSFNGAAAMMCLPDLIKSGEVEEKDYYIIPSSVHECILVDGSVMDPITLNMMISDVNNTCVATEDFLSDFALKYDMESGKIIVAA